MFEGFSVEGGGIWELRGFAEMMGLDFKKRNLVFGSKSNFCSFILLRDSLIKGQYSPLCLLKIWSFHRYQIRKFFRMKAKNLFF